MLLCEYFVGRKEPNNDNKRLANSGLCDSPVFVTLFFLVIFRLFAVADFFSFVIYLFIRYIFIIYMNY